MSRSVSDGVWPTMITPFTPADTLDEQALEHLVEWYLQRGVSGLFAVCQSSEMFHLSLEERVGLARSVVRLSGGRVPVIASGHVSDDLSAQAEEVRRIADTGVDAVVLVTNRFAAREEPDEVWRRRLERFLAGTPRTVPLGFYECPYPYKRLLSPAMLRWCADTGRFLFLKDTCCDLEQMRARQEALAGTSLKIFNANAATLLTSLEFGIAGYSGVMANFHPQLYSWLCAHAADRPREAARLQDLLGFASLVEHQAYPVNAKYFLQLEGLPLTLQTRVRSAGDLSAAGRLEVEQLRAVVQRCGEAFTRGADQDQYTVTIKGSS